MWYFFRKLRFDNGDLSNVRPIFGGFGRSAGTGGLMSIWHHKRAYGPRGKSHLPQKVRLLRVGRNMPKQA